MKTALPVVNGPERQVGEGAVAATAGCQQTVGGVAVGSPRKEHVPAPIGGLTVQMLRQSFPGWRIFRELGKWWALRGGPVRLDGPESLLLRVITARDLTGLAERLCLQHLDQLDPQELAAVYRDMALPRAPVRNPGGGSGTARRAGAVPEAAGPGRIVCGEKD